MWRYRSLPLPHFGFPPRAFEQVTPDDVIIARTRADHRLPWSILRTNTRVFQSVRAALSLNLFVPPWTTYLTSVCSVCWDRCADLCGLLTLCWTSRCLFSSSFLLAVQSADSCDSCGAHTTTYAQTAVSPHWGCHTNPHNQRGQRSQTCAAMVFMVGSRSLSRSKPWWKKVNWAWTKENIWKCKLESVHEDDRIRDVPSLWHHTDTWVEKKNWALKECGVWGLLDHKNRK